MSIPEEVWAIGKVRDPGESTTPIRGVDEFGDEVGLAPLTVLDADGERAMPVYSTLDKAHQGIENLMSEEERRNVVGCTLVGFEALYTAMSQRVEGVPSAAYLGLDMMGEGRGQYALVRL
jgi:hypothetical protein